MNNSLERETQMQTMKQIFRRVIKVVTKKIEKALFFSLVFILAAIFQPASSWSQQNCMTVQNTRIDSSQFPSIVSSVTVWDQNNLPIGGLSESNFFSS